MTSTTKQLPLFESSLNNGPSPYQPQKIAEKSIFSKYVVYVDESGDHSLKSIDTNYPVFVLAFCVFHKRHYSEVIVPALEKFKFNYFGHDQVVLHENEIRKEKGPFSFFRNRQDKVSFIGALTEIIGLGKFVLISCCIDKTKLGGGITSDDNPYHIALAYCLEALYEFLQEKGEKGKKTHVIVECRGKKEDEALELEFRRICDGNNRFSHNLPFEVIFSDKKAMSSGLQFADLVARPIGLSVLRPEQENRAFAMLKEKFFCKGGRRRAGAGYEDVGLKIFPSK